MNAYAVVGLSLAALSITSLCSCRIQHTCYGTDSVTAERTLEGETLLNAGQVEKETRTHNCTTAPPEKKLSESHSNVLQYTVMLQYFCIHEQ